MGVVYPYLDHSGSLTPNHVGYEVSLPFPASNLYNFGFNYSGGAGTSFCMWQPVNHGGTFLPTVARNNWPVYVQILDRTYGWRNWRRVQDFVGTGSLSQQGRAVTSSSGAAYTVDNPVQFRISYPSEFPSSSPSSISWTGLNVGLDDVCYLPPPDPAALVGTGECGSWSLVGAPNTSGTSLVTTLPNGAPLAGRNRVQLIS